MNDSVFVCPEQPDSIFKGGFVEKLRVTDGFILISAEIVESSWHVQEKIIKSSWHVP